MAFTPLSGLWEVSQDGTKARKYKLGQDVSTPTAIRISGTANYQFWRADGSEIGIGPTFYEQWRDNGELYSYSGFSHYGSVSSGVDYSLISPTFPTIADAVFYREVEKIATGGIKFIPPDPPLPLELALAVPFGYLTALSLNITTLATERVYVSSLHEYVTRYRRQITVNNYSVEPLICTLTRQIVKGNGKINARHEIQDQCNTTYSPSSYTVPDVWIGVRSVTLSSQVSDGIYSAADLESSLGLEYRTISDMYPVLPTSLSWTLNNALSYSS